MSGLEHSARVAYARDVLAKTKATGAEYGDVVAQKLELWHALEQVLPYADELLAIVNEQVKQP